MILEASEILTQAAVDHHFPIVPRCTRVHKMEDSVLPKRQPYVRRPIGAAISANYANDFAALVLRLNAGHLALGNHH
jgi:hypothetical protein